MDHKASSPPFRMAAGLFPAVLLLLLLQTGAIEAAPWYFLPTFGHDVRWVQGITDGYFAMAGQKHPDGGTPPPPPRAGRRRHTMRARRRYIRTGRGRLDGGDAVVTSGGMRSRLENMMLHFFLEKTRNPV